MMSSLSTSNPSKSIAPGQKKKQDLSSFRFNPNAKPYEPSERLSSPKPAEQGGAQCEYQIQDPIDSMGYSATNTFFPQPAPFELCGWQYQPIPPNPTQYGCPLPLHLASQTHGVNLSKSGLQPVVPMMYPPPPQPVMYVHPAESVPYNGYVPYQHQVPDQQYSGPQYAPMNMQPQQQFDNMLSPVMTCYPWDFAPTTSVGESWSSSTQKLQSTGQVRPKTRDPSVQNKPVHDQNLAKSQPSKKESQISNHRSQSKPQTCAQSNQTVTEEVPDISKEQEYVKLRMELEHVKRQYSAVELWAESEDIDLKSVVADYIAAGTSKKVSVPNPKAVTLNDVVKADTITKKKTLEKPKASKLAESTPKKSSEIAHRVVRPEHRKKMSTEKHILDKLSIHPIETVPISVRVQEFFQAVGIELKQPNSKNTESSSTPEEGKRVDDVSKIVLQVENERSSTAKAAEKASCEEPKAEVIDESTGEKVVAEQPEKQEREECSKTKVKQDACVIREDPVRQENIPVPKTIHNALDVHCSTTEPVTKSDAVRDECQDIFPVQELARHTPMTSTTEPETLNINDSPIVEPCAASDGVLDEKSKIDVGHKAIPTSEWPTQAPIAFIKAPETIGNEEKENVRPHEKKVPDYSNWVDRDKIHKKWAAESVQPTEMTNDAVMDNPSTESLILQQSLTKGSMELEAEQTANQQSERILTADVKSTGDATKESPIVMETTFQHRTSSESSSSPEPLKETEIEYESQEVKEEEHFKALLRTQDIDDQCENIEKWVFSKAKRELLNSQRSTPINAKRLNEKSLKDLVDDYVDALYEYSDVMYLNRASYLAFKRERATVHRFQELMVTHWRHNPLFAHRAKRAAAKIDSFVRTRMEQYKVLNTSEGQQMYCFLAVLALMDRKCLTADLLFLYGTPKSESLLKEHEQKYFDMVISFRDWEPEQYRPKPAYSEDMERLPVKLYVGDMVNFLRLINHQCYRRIQKATGDEEMDRVQSLVCKAYIDSRSKEIDWTPQKTTKFLRSRLTKLKKIKDPSEEIIQHKKYYEFLMHVSSSILDFDVYWFKQCLDVKNTEEWHCLKSDADFFSYLFTTFR